MRKTAPAVILAMLIGGLILPLPPALADHTDPDTPRGPIAGPEPESLVTQGAGTWKFIRNFPANPGSDLEYWHTGKGIYASGGTLGQGDEDFVGQRIFRLTRLIGTAPNKTQKIDTLWLNDHGSAACTLGSTGVTGLQHDVTVTPKRNAQLLIDTTDSTGRCHDSPNGGLEIVDIHQVGQNRAPGWEPREIHLTRHMGTSHTVTLDETRPWIVYNSSSSFNLNPWIDVLDIRTCLGIQALSLAQKRNTCRPKVYRIPLYEDAFSTPNFEPGWTRMRDIHGGQLVAGTEAACHDITVEDGLLYCASLNATLILDVSNLTDASGNIRGTRLDCPVLNGAPGEGGTDPDPDTGADVTDCGNVGPGTAGNPTPEATGWEFLGTFHHPGRDCVPHPPGAPVSNCNSNNFVPSEDGVSVSHESDPLLDGQYMAVTDERGGGVVPPGASCTSGIDNQFGNGGMHIFDISDPANIAYAETPSGDEAVWRSEVLAPAATFCDIHVIEAIPGEQRLIVAYYSSGTKIVDYWIDENGDWIFRETASLILPGANTWAVEDFHIQELPGGQRKYSLLASDIQRGLDVLQWTGPTNPIGTPPPAEETGAVDAAMGFGLLALPAAAWFGRRRRRRKS